MLNAKYLYNEKHFQSGKIFVVPKIRRECPNICVEKRQYKLIIIVRVKENF